LGPGQAVPLTEPQAHYLFGVMRLAAGAAVSLFNGTDGEWRARVLRAAKRGGDLTCEAQTAPQIDPPDLWLMFAPLKKARTDFIVEKAVELGAARIMPVQTEFTSSDRIRPDKQQLHAIEAAEQCGATFVPPVAELAPLARMLSAWDPRRRILWADESLAGPGAAALPALAAQAPAQGPGPAGQGQGPASPVQQPGPGQQPAPGQGPGQGPGPWAILIGPEGGFSPAEVARLRAAPFVVPVSLGPRILRAETAALAALVMWQSALGDWR